MRRRFWLGASLVLVLILVVGPATSMAAGGQTVITFENDPVGDPADGFTSADSAIAHFYDSKRSDLQLADFGEQSHGQALAVNPDDPSFLRIKFDQDMCSISLAFGNDDPTASNEGDPAKLRLFNDGVRVGNASVVMNRNDIMDQTIALDGIPFDRAEFYYAVTTDFGLAEVVDDMSFSGC
jgi:hypothetical protein